MIITEHAEEEMLHSNISKDDVRACLDHGELVIKQIVSGEKRYGKQIALKDKTIIVIYTHQHNEERVITTYPIRRKRQW